MIHTYTYLHVQGMYMYLHTAHAPCMQPAHSVYINVANGHKGHKYGEME